MPLLRRRVHPERLIPGQSSPAPALTLQTARQPARVVWRFSDGKPGHDCQSLGLVDALRRRLPLQCYDIPVQTGAGSRRKLTKFF